MADRVVYGTRGATVTAINGKLLEALAKDPRRLAVEVRKQFVLIGNHLMKEASTGWPKFTDGPKPRSAKIASRKGKLQQSIKGFARGRKLDDLAVVLKAGGVLAPYAAVQEFGTVGAGGKLPDIRSKKSGGKLTIPLTPVLTPTGNTKMAFKLKVIGTRPRSGKPMWGTSRGPTFIAGNAIMQSSVSGRMKPYPIYALKDRVAIPPRLGLRNTIRANDQFIQRRILRALQLTLEPTPKAGK